MCQFVPSFFHGMMLYQSACVHISEEGTATLLSPFIFLLSLSSFFEWNSPGSIIVISAAADQAAGMLDRVPFAHSETDDGIACMSFSSHSGHSFFFLISSTDMNVCWVIPKGAIQSCTLYYRSQLRGASKDCVNFLPGLAKEQDLFWPIHGATNSNIVP